MKNSQLSIIIALLLLLLAINQLAGPIAGLHVGGLPWYGWVGISIFFVVVGILFALRDAAQARRLLEEPTPAAVGGAAGLKRFSPEDLEKIRQYDPDGPDYPHPVVITERCIGCHACVDACPHDVLALVGGVSTPVARDQCMEDTACEVECPVNPKACVVINTNKKISPRIVPERFKDKVFMTNVPGVYIIGDVSGTPLIKNAANEGAAVMVHIAHELRGGNGAAPSKMAEPVNERLPPGDYDVAIIGAGPAGLSAAVMARKLGINYVGLEQDVVMSTIVKYPKGKYVFLKPETMGWEGGIRLPSLEEYVEETLEEVVDEPHRSQVKVLLAQEREGKLDKAGEETLKEIRDSYQALLQAELDKTIDAAWSQRLASARRKYEALLDQEDKYELAELLAQESAGTLLASDVVGRDRLNIVRAAHGDQLASVLNAGKLSEERYNALAAARNRVAGDQREVLLNTWFMNMKEVGVVINDNESCKSVKPVQPGGPFTIETKLGNDTRTYTARRVVIAVGNAGTPMKLKVPGETYTVKSKGPDGNEIDEEKQVQVTRDGVEEDKVKYKLTDPSLYKRKKIIVVGAGNSAIEAAVDLVATRQGDQITIRPETERNEVTLLVRSDLKNDLKFGNKQQIYDCYDSKILDIKWGAAIKEVHDDRVVVVKARGGEEIATIPNDYIFALIGGDKPIQFLKNIGINFPGMPERKDRGGGKNGGGKDKGKGDKPKK